MHSYMRTTCRRPLHKTARAVGSGVCGDFLGVTYYTPRVLRTFAFSVFRIYMCIPLSVCSCVPCVCVVFAWVFRVPFGVGFSLPTCFLLTCISSAQLWMH